MALEARRYLEIDPAATPRSHVRAARRVRSKVAEKLIGTPVVERLGDHAQPGSFCQPSRERCRRYGGLGAPGTQRLGRVRRVRGPVLLRARRTMRAFLCSGVPCTCTRARYVCCVRDWDVPT